MVAEPQMSSQGQGIRDFLIKIGFVAFVFILFPVFVDELRHPFQCKLAVSAGKQSSAAKPLEAGVGVSNPMV